MKLLKNLDARLISQSGTYFVADIAANHDGSLDRALELISLARQSGADCAKFQHFSAQKIISPRGFESLGKGMAHQESWQESVFRVFERASLPWEWTAHLKAHCETEGIDFMSTPYDLGAIDHIDPYVDAYKIGSGDIDWLEELSYVASKGKPVLLATGASTLDEVYAAVKLLEAQGVDVVLMQCNTNYSGKPENLQFINLRVLTLYREIFSGVSLGLSDHTEGHATVLGAVALGARVIEKHFTDSNDRSGPDHPFSMTPLSWREMVDRTRELELALGDGFKRVEENENESRVVQRRCLWATKDLPMGTIVGRVDVVPLRPAVAGGLSPALLDWVIGRKVARDVQEGEVLTMNCFLENDLDK